MSRICTEGGEESCKAHGEGWLSVLSWLQKWLTPEEKQIPSKHYLLRLVAPRQSFAFDMSETEKTTMGEHAAYWMERLHAGTAVIFGPVLDPAGPWGLAAMEVGSEDELKRLMNADPAIAGIQGMRWEAMPFLQAAARPR